MRVEGDSDEVPLGGMRWSRRDESVGDGSFECNSIHVAV